MDFQLLRLWRQEWPTTSVGLRFLLIALVWGGMGPEGNAAEDLPAGFDYLSDIEPSIVQDIRYAGAFNFTGRPVKGYEAAKCILRRRAAEALAAAQKDFQKQGLSLKTLDCYRPVRATRAFVEWSQSTTQDASALKAEFFPAKDKASLFQEGFISLASKHSTGLAVDVTLVAPSDPRITEAKGGGTCDGPADMRQFESSLDFGTTFDCFSERSARADGSLSKEGRANRKLLAKVMERHGFQAYRREWWHFQLPAMPAEVTPMDFPVR